MMRDITGRIWRKLRALLQGRVDVTSPLDTRFDGLPALHSRGQKAISGSGTSADTRRNICLAPQVSNPCPCDVPLPGSPTLDDLLRQLAVIEADGDPPDTLETNRHGVDGGAVALEPADQLDVLNAPTQNIAEDETHDDRQEVSVELTPEQAQAVREGKYFVSEGEDETDYTRGPARMIEATDGVDTCTALLMTLGLSQALQKAIKAQRDYHKAKATSNDKTEALLRFESTLEAQIASHRSHLTAHHLEAAKKNALEAELYTLALMVDEYKMERTAIKNNLNFQGDMLRKIQAKANAVLEDALIDAHLLGPELDEPQTPCPEFNLQIEYQAFQRKLRAADESLHEEDAPLDISNDHLRIAVTIAEKEKQEEAERLHEDVWNAWDRVEAAQAEFDGRDYARMEAEGARDATIKRGDQPEDATSEAFDVRWHQYERELTRELIEAEDAYRAVQKALADAGADEPFADCDSEMIDMHADAESDCSSAAEDEVIAAAPTARIMQWMSDIPAPEDALMPDIEYRSELGEGDGWDAAELEVGDSISVFIDREIAASHNPYKAKIDEWRKVQEDLAASFAAE